MSCGRQMLNDETRLQEQTQMLRMEESMRRIGPL